MSIHDYLADELRFKRNITFLYFRHINLALVLIPLRWKDIQSVITSAYTCPLLWQGFCQGPGVSEASMFTENAPVVLSVRSLVLSGYSSDVHCPSQHLISSGFSTLWQ